MNEQLKFYKGFESDLPKDNIEPGVLYHCTDTGNTYRGTDINTLELFSSAAGKITYDDNGNKNIIFDSGISCFQGDVYVNGTDLENKDTQFNTTINNLNTEITDLKNKVNTNTNNITSLSNKTIPISQGGTGATTVNQAMSNLGGHMLPLDGI